MHEMSIAESVYELARKNVPEHASLRCVRMQAGPMRGIEPDAMDWAWRALMQTTHTEDVTLELDLLPWSLRCTACDRVFKADDLFTTCACGSDQTAPVGGDELKLVSIDVDDDT